MKFLHLSTGDVRGAFSGAHRLHRNLLAHGHESVMLVGDKQSQDQTVVAPAKAVQFVGRSLVRAQNQLLKLAIGRDRQVAHHFAFNKSITSVGSLMRSIGDFRPDLIVAHYTSGFLSPATLVALHERLGSPVALYLMDMEMLTGGCHYAWSCTGYLGNCQQCPGAPMPLLQRGISRQWNKRKESFTQLAPVVVPATGWLARQAAASSLTKHLAHAQILIGIDPQTYTPRDKVGLRRRFGLPADALVIYFGAQNVADPRKGFVHLKAGLEQLARLLEVPECAKVVLFTVGNLDQDVVGALPFTHVHQPYMADEASFAATYAAADVFVCPSVEDSGPMMINEAIVSGTPVIAFEMGVSVDLVQHGITGFLVPLADAQALAGALASFLRLAPEERGVMSASCRELGVEKSSSQAQVRAFVELARAAGLTGATGLHI